MRLIDADAVYKDMKNKLVLKPEEFATRVHYIQSAALNCVAGAPTIEAKPVVHAHWKKWGCEGTVCSNCHGRVLYECDEQEKKSKYCPNCGAQMDESISCSHEDDNHIAEDGKKGTKIPVISMEDVPKIMEEMEK